jgi:hypothetical protein
MYLGCRVQQESIVANRPLSVIRQGVVHRQQSPANAPFRLEIRRQFSVSAARLEIVKI